MDTPTTEDTSEAMEEELLTEQPGDSTVSVEQGPINMEQSSAEFEQTSVEVEQFSHELGQTSAEIEQTSAEVEQTSAEVEQTSAEVEQNSAEVEENSATIDEDDHNSARFNLDTPMLKKSTWMTNVLDTYTLRTVAIQPFALELLHEESIKNWMEEASEYHMCKPKSKECVLAMQFVAEDMGDSAFLDLKASLSKSHPEVNVWHPALSDLNQCQLSSCVGSMFKTTGYSDSFFISNSALLSNVPDTLPISEIKQAFPQGSNFLDFRDKPQSEGIVTFQLNNLQEVLSIVPQNPGVDVTIGDVTVYARRLNFALRKWNKRITNQKVHATKTEGQLSDEERISLLQAYRDLKQRYGEVHNRTDIFVGEKMQERKALGTEMESMYDKIIADTMVRSQKTDQMPEPEDLHFPFIKHKLGVWAQQKRNRANKQKVKNEREKNLKKLQEAKERAAREKTAREEAQRELKRRTKHEQQLSRELQQKETREVKLQARLEKQAQDQANRQAKLKAKLERQVQHQARNQPKMPNWPGSTPMDFQHAEVQAKKKKSQRPLSAGEAQALVAKDEQRKIDVIGKAQRDINETNQKSTAALGKQAKADAKKSGGGWSRGRGRRRGFQEPDHFKPGGMGGDFYDDGSDFSFGGGGGFSSQWEDGMSAARMMEPIMGAGAMNQSNFQQQQMDLRRREQELEDRLARLEQMQQQTLQVQSTMLDTVIQTRRREMGMNQGNQFKAFDGNQF